MIFERLGRFIGGMKGSVGAVGKSGVAFGFKSVDPFSDNGRAGVKGPGGGFDAVGETVLDHLITPLFFVFRVSHDLAILVRAHVVLEPPLNPLRFQEFYNVPTSLFKVNIFSQGMIIKPFFDTHPTVPVCVIAGNRVGGFISAAAENVFRCSLCSRAEIFSPSLPQRVSFKEPLK